MTVLRRGRLDRFDVDAYDGRRPESLAQTALDLDRNIMRFGNGHRTVQPDMYVDCNGRSYPAGLEIVRIVHLFSGGYDLQNLLFGLSGQRVFEQFADCLLYTSPSPRDS